MALEKPSEFNTLSLVCQTCIWESFGICRYARAERAREGVWPSDIVRYRFCDILDIYGYLPQMAQPSTDTSELRVLEENLLKPLDDCK